MEHIGIDLGARHSHLSVLDEAGRRIGQSRLQTDQLPLWLSTRAPARVVIEACTQSPAIARAAKDAGHEVKIVPGQLVRTLGVGRRGIKTDERDAVILAEAAHRIPDLPSVHVRSTSSTERRQLLSARQLLLEQRTAVSNHCKSFLRGRLQGIRGRAQSRAFSEAVRTVALKHCEGLPLAIEVLLDAYDHLTEKIEGLTAELERMAKTDPICRTLMSMPGVGPQIALAFTAQLDDPHRFAGADELGSYLALVPGEHTTGGKVVRTATLRAGPRTLKALLVQGAWSMWRCRSQDPLVLWARALAERRGRRIAIVALARKMAVILWAMWKHDCTYDPLRASNHRPEMT